MGMHGDTNKIRMENTLELTAIDVGRINHDPRLKADSRGAGDSGKEARDGLLRRISIPLRR